MMADAISQNVAFSALAELPKIAFGNTERHRTMVERTALRGSMMRPSTDGVFNVSSLPVAVGVSVVATTTAARRRRQRKVSHKQNLVAMKNSVREDIRNIAIIAHVDHGKTTLTDALMKQTGMVKIASMDSNMLERERGITILAKNAAVKHKGIKVNLIDTPGHADFGGEVERILNMADGCLLLVDAQEGPMPQTKFVLRKALDLKKRVLVCINKVDKPAARPDWVLDTTFDLFNELGAHDDLCDFPVCYASGLKGHSSTDDPKSLQESLVPLLDQILAECPKPDIIDDQPLQMLVANLDYDDYKGRICIGRITSGSLKVGQTVGFQYGEGGEVRKATISYLWEFQHNEKSEVEEVTAGDICAFAGMNDVTIGDTVVDPDSPMPLPPIVVEEPTVVMEFGVNTSPLVGKEKETRKITSGEIEKRLQKEVMTNLALRVEPGRTSESFKVKGRGILQLGVLIENMRREGYELMVGAPEVILRKDPETGKKQEPYEECVVEVPREYQGVVMEEMQKKMAVMKNMEAGAMENSMILTFEIPTSCLIGMQGLLLNRSHGTSHLTSQLSHWGDIKKDGMKLRDKGSIVTMAGGKATAYAIQNMQARGSSLVEPGDDVYAGMCVGIHTKAADIEVNIAKDKATTNVRAGGFGGTSGSVVGSAVKMSLDGFLGHMDTDEALEVTPNNLRLLKKNAKGLKR